VLGAWQKQMRMVWMKCHREATESSPSMLQPYLEYLNTRLAGRFPGKCECAAASADTSRVPLTNFSVRNSIKHIIHNYTISNKFKAWNSPNGAERGEYGASRWLALAHKLPSSFQPIACTPCLSDTSCVCACAFACLSGPLGCVCHARL